MTSDTARPLDLVPRDKHDTQRALALVELGYPGVEPALPAMLEWVQDRNWPVARVLAPFLASIGEPLLPHVLKVLATDDDCWKASVLSDIIAKSPTLRCLVKADLLRLANTPTVAERAEDLDVLAKKILNVA